MRGGRFEQRARGDANVRNAEVLLESRSVAEIREVEAATRKEIQDKKEELRQLVGASYMDLIDSADSIVTMGRCCDCIMANLVGMTQGFDCLKNSLATNSPAATDAVPGVDSERERREKLYGIGSRVKYLVDTPEKIWGCLDEHMYLEAAERYLRAREVHNLLLSDTGGGDLLAHFPLLRHQWPLVETFQSQISLRSRDRLQHTGLSAGEYAVALAAVAIVEDLSSSQVFSLFLESRKAWLRSYLRPAVAEKLESSHGNAAILSKVVGMIQVTLCHIGQMFLEVSNGVPPLLFSTILTAPPSSQLFGGISNPESEVSIWKVHREKLEGSMVPLSGEVIAQGSLSFLTSCAQELHSEGKPLLDSVSSAKELAEMERSIRLDIDKQEALTGSLDWLKGAFGHVINSPWEFLSNLLLKKPLNLWDTLFEIMFVRRVEAIIDSRIDGITITTMVDEHLEKIDIFSCFQQPCIGLLRRVFAEEIRENSKQLQLDVAKGPGSHINLKERLDREWFGGIDSYFGPDVCRLKETVDEGLKAIHKDLLAFLGNAQSSSRTDKLAPYLHERIFSCMSNISRELEERLRDLTHTLEDFIDKASSSAGDAASTLIKVERALFLGRLSLALGQHLSYLPIILGPPERWILDDKGSSKPKGNAHVLPRLNSWFEREDILPENSNRLPLKRTGMGTPGSDEILLKPKKLQDGLTSQWDLAHRLWVSWSTDLLVKLFLRDLGTDECLSTKASLKGWEETVLKQESDGSEVEIKMSLPALASPYAIALLFVANQEIYRVGGHVLDKVILHLFAASLLDKILVTYERFISDPSVADGRLSEKGLLQLLFDVRFLADVLIGLEEVPPVLDREYGSAVRPHSQRRRIKSLLLTLHSKLDPIDWATYEPQLWENEQRSYQRSAVLFGFLTQLNRLYTNVGHRTQPGADPNTLSLSATVPRFTYLPISMPVLSVNGGSIAPRMSAAHEGGVSKNYKENFTFEDSTGFTSLVGARPLLKSLMGQVGSKLGEGTLKFGSMISDGQVGKLRDKSAAAISTFGDILPALSSLTAAGATKLEGYEGWKVS